MQRLYALIDEKFLDRKYIQQSTDLYYIDFVSDYLF